MNGLKMVAITDPGMVRSNNEDSIATDLANGFAVLADGMGGHQAGEVASSMAIDVIRQHMRDFISQQPSFKNKDLVTKSMANAIKLANTATNEVSHSRPECAGMGSTVVVSLLYDDKICIGHVGDSRCYRLRDKRLTLLTEDHSVVQELLSRGLITPEEAKNSSNKNLVTRALGVDDSVEPDVKEEIVRQNDVYLMCSDGLNDVLPDSDIEKVMLDHGNDLEASVKQLVKDVNQRGGPDNVSIILIRTAASFDR